MIPRKESLFGVIGTCLTLLLLTVQAIASSAKNCDENTVMAPPYNGSLVTCLRDAADDAYLMIEKAWSPEDPNYQVNYWVEGAAFANVLDYFLTSLDSPPPPNKELVAQRARDFAQTVVDEYNRAACVPGNACWWDDNGWWSAVAVRAAAKKNRNLWLEEDGETELKVNDNIFGGDECKEEMPGPSLPVRRMFQSIALENWKQMDRNAPDVWDDCQNGGNSASCLAAFGTLEPLHEGGIWNSRWAKWEWHIGSTEEQQALLQLCHPSKADPEFPLACDPLFGSKTENGQTIDGWPLCGIQNTVTNGLYLVSAARLFTERSRRSANQKGQYFLGAARQEWTFLNQWFQGKGLDDLGKDAQTHRLLFRFMSTKTGKSHILVRERPSVHLDGSDSQGYEERVIWAGDQGLILSGLVDLMIALGGPDNRHYTELLNLAKGILDGVRDFLVTENDQGEMQLLAYRDGTGCQPSDEDLNSWVCSDELPRIDPCSPLDPTPDVVPSCPKVKNVPSPAWRAPGGDPWDYNTGVGIFMSHLLYAFNNNDDLREHILTEGDYLPFLKSYGRLLSDRTIVDDPVKDSESITFTLKPCLEPCNMPTAPLMGRLGALVAAMEIIKESE